ncbi:MAG: exodeoxyribonuclease V subunit beta [Verrucomicrobiae bacterium]
MTFDLVNTPLDLGVTRLEASAGTGKTFALAGIFLRLLVEEKIPASDILVVTFTEAATAELRDRIRRRLAEALRALAGEPTDDALLLALIDRTQNRRAAALNSLRNALEIFDLISISTIHGFCQRTLADSAFESGILFNVELVADQDNFIREIAADYFRRQVHASGAVQASLALHQKLTPDFFAALLKRFLTYPELKLLPAAPRRPLPEVVAELETAFAKCASEWTTLAQDRGALMNYFIGGKKWANSKHAKESFITDAMAGLDTGLDASRMSAGIWDAIEFFSVSAVRAAVGKKTKMPEPYPALFDTCEKLVVLAAELVLAQRLDFLSTARAALVQRKQEAKQQSYDDLISRLATALAGSSGSALANSVRKKFRVALIDESQDTDPLQWIIFKEIFAKSPEHRLYLIGDPKQAIYGFRGADVQTYLIAAKSAGHQYELDTNWRSESALVGAVNTIFASAGKTTAFVEEQISFEPVKAAKQADAQPIIFPPDGNRPPPFQVWCANEDNGGWSARSAQKLLPAAVAAEISRLLRAEVRIENRRLNPRDIAVLVESHRQAGWVQTALHDLQIPSVEQAMDSVFASAEARELQWILTAILNPSREAGIKCALTTDIFGLDGNQLSELTVNEAGWQMRLQDFARYRSQWERDGFFSMFSDLLRAEKVIEKLLRFTDAERRITNLLHLAELLETASRAEHLGPTQLVQWLEKRRASDAVTADEFQLRLESDEDAVQIITIHRSKGLEYPVVFCPFATKDAELGKIKSQRQTVMEVVLFHDPATQALTWDLNTAPALAHIQQTTKEQLAEKVRLLYVALTRARHRCYLVSAPSTKKKSTALAWLLKGQSENLADPVEFLNAQSPTATDWKNGWLALAEKSPASLAVADLPLAPGEPWRPEKPDDEKLGSKTCARDLKPSWFLTSFTQLSQSAHAAVSDLPDRDATDVAAKPADTEAEIATEIFALPTGARTGDCLHQILEKFDFANDDKVLTTALVEQQLAAFDLAEARHVEAVAAMLERLRHAPLALDNPVFTLANIRPTQRLSEMVFHFPVGQLDAESLAKLIRDQKHSSPKALPAEGFLKGFIDLIFEFDGRFYIVDWKSNSLGHRVEDYDVAAMQREVTERSYDLQYHLYTVALDKFLRARLADYDYEKHFGGVRYIFLRGVTPEKPELGILHARPTAEKIAQLSELLSSGTEVKP